MTILHFAVPSPMTEAFARLPRGRVLQYHNITPARFFLGFHPHLAGLCHHGRRELEAFAPRAELGLGDSEFNRRELEEAGFPRTAVLPIVLDLSLYDRALATYDADDAFDRLCDAWGMKPPRERYALLVYDKPGGGFATGDVGEAHQVTGVESPGMVNKRTRMKLSP